MTVSLASRLHECLVPAALTPMSMAREIDIGQLERYATQLAHQDIGGIAVWAHTGRGPHLTADQRTTVLRVFRQATSLPLLAGVTDLAAAEAALELGADGLLAFPPPPGTDPVSYHRQLVGEFDAPLVLFLLYGAAGGIDYDEPVLRELLALPQVVGLKLATLDSAMKCQDVIRLIRDEFPDKLAITGEDRMFGPSLMWGAQAALVGIAAAAVPVSARLVNAWFYQDAAEFLAASTNVDRLARAVFRAPMEGYVQRMLWLAAYEGMIADEAANDPFGPPLGGDERDSILTAYQGVTDWAVSTE